MKHARLTTPIEIPVWDPFVRLFHWSLVGAVTLAALTGYLLGATWLGTHLVAGSVAAGLVLARLVWGVIGSGPARFRSFVTGPRAVIAHLRELRAGHAPRHLGHNPLGAVMILALIGTVLALALSGLMQLGGEFKAGPLAGWLSYGAARGIAEIHQTLALALMGLIALHVAGALFESWRTADNLPRAMLTGRKQMRPGDHGLHQSLAHLPGRGALAAIILAAGLAALGGAALALRPPAGDVQPANPTYGDECAACHMAYPPSLLPADSWSGLMQTLSDHFGEDASLDAATTAELTAWLRANAAESADTKPAHVFARTARQAPFTLTETPFWRETHAGIDKALFRRAPIYSAANCAACHQDAESGRFYPLNITIPKEDPSR